ncbi:hypothetical protein L1887_34126 [Cichorium endivia]|nr:hypothetical protein L1887_34126 [Cichorium endivia]
MHLRQYQKPVTNLTGLISPKVSLVDSPMVEPSQISLGDRVSLRCTPTEIARFGTNGKLCVDKINDAVKLFNDRLKPLVVELNNDLPDARFTFINLTNILSPGVREDGQCIRNSIPCLIRVSAFYDGFHPTEISNTGIASRSYNALSPMDASPYDISCLTSLAKLLAKLIATTPRLSPSPSPSPSWHSLARDTSPTAPPGLKHDSIY